MLGVTVSYLMNWEEDKQRQPTNDELSERKKLFMQKVEGMSDDQLERLERILALVENKEV